MTNTHPSASKIGHLSDRSHENRLADERRRAGFTLNDQRHSRLDMTVEIGCASQKFSKADGNGKAPFTVTGQRQVLRPDAKLQLAVRRQSGRRGKVKRWPATTSAPASCPAGTKFIFGLPMKPATNRLSGSL